MVKIINKIFFTRSNIDISSGSIIMAIGIFLLGAIHQFSNHIGWFLTIILIFTWGVMLTTFIGSLFRDEYRKYLSTFPISKFGAGTWIAATSVIGILVHHYEISFFLPIVKGLLIFNFIMWVIYLRNCIHNFNIIITNKEIENTHGIILLPTVCTQSIVCLSLSVYGSTFPNTIIIILIVTGVLLYLFSVMLLLIRFIRKRKHQFLHEWKNTDCIIHGAVSITGVAATLSGLFSYRILFFIWFLAFSLFLLIEFIEIVRGCSRIKLYGLKLGIFKYHISQWSRNFTFGMFYFFTSSLNKLNPTIGYTFIFQKYINHILGWIVLYLAIIQTFLLLYSIVNIQIIMLAKNRKNQASINQ